MADDPTRGEGRDEACASGPVRMCVICRRRMAKSDLRRYVCPPSGGARLIHDELKRLPGRGFYLCQSAECGRKFDRPNGWQGGWRKKCKGEING